MILTAKIVLLEKESVHPCKPCTAYRVAPTRIQGPGPTNQSLTGGRCDRSQLRRKRESYIFPDQIEIALVREAERSEMFTYVLDQNFRRRRASGQAHAAYAFQPLRVNILGIVD